MTISAAHPRLGLGGTGGLTAHASERRGSGRHGLAAYRLPRDPHARSTDTLLAVAVRANIARTSPARRTPSSGAPRRGDRHLQERYGASLGRWTLKARRFLVHHILHADDTPHKVALGAAAGMFAAVVPFVGCQTAVAVAIAALLRANKAVCIPMVWVSNPFTVIPLYGTCLYVGRLVLPGAHDTDLRHELAKLAPPETWAGFLSTDYWSTLIHNMWSLGLELWIGILIVGVVSAILTYFASRWGVAAYRERRRRIQLFRSLFRPAPRPSV